MSYATGEMILFPIPRELLEEIGLSEMDVIQMSVANDKLIIEKAHTEGFVCNGECDSCPLAELDCVGDCESCPCSSWCEESEDEGLDENI